MLALFSFLPLQSTLGFVVVESRLVCREVKNEIVLAVTVHVLDVATVCRSCTATIVDDVMGAESVPHILARRIKLIGLENGNGDDPVTIGIDPVVTTAVEEAPYLDSDGVYLLVSPRTPYNRVPLPMMSLSYQLDRDGDVVSEGLLQAAIEPAAGYHYGAAVDDLSAGDTLTVGVDSPPQVSRHEGYETAFLEMNDVALTVR